MSKLKEAALAYAARGWPVFPCGRNKAPIVETGFHAATTNPDQIASWWDAWPDANIGFAVGQAGMMVVDLDPGHDPILAQSLPPTALEQASPRGRHLFYALAEGEICKSPQSRVAEHVDVRSDRAYVLLCPSVTADGAYTWVSEGRPAYRPDEILRIANSARDKNPERDVWPIAPDLPENVQRAIAWLQDTAAPAIEGQLGDSKTVATAAMLRSLGISESKALDLMLDLYNPRCEPPWDDDAMALKVRNGYLFANGQPGELTQAFREAQVRALFSPVDIVIPISDLTQVGRFRAVDRDGMDLIKEPTWLIHDCIPEGGYAVLFGPPGGLKTFVALDMALSVATGTTFPWGGLWPRVNGSRPVLFAAGEGRANIVKRVMAWEKKHWGGRRVKNFIMVDPVPRVAEPEVFRDFLKLGDNMSPDGYALVVIDTVGRAMSAINENAQEHASKFTLMVAAMQQHFGCAVLALHHTGHGNGDRAKGSIVFEADADTMIRVDRESKDSPILELVMTKQKDAAEWRDPRVAEAYEILLPGGRKSLAVGEPSEETLEALKPVEGAGQDKPNVLEIVEAAAEKVLKSVTGRVWSQKALAEAVAMDPNIDIPSNRLANHWLVMLREKTGSKAASWYEPATARWRMK